MLRRWIVGLLAILLLVAGAVIGGASWWLWDTFSRTDGARADLGRITASGGAQAVIVDIARIDVQLPYLPDRGRTELLASDPDGGQVQLGLAPTDLVDATLFGSHYAVASRVDGRWQLTDVPGGAPADLGGIEVSAGAPAAVPVHAGDQGTLVIQTPSGTVDLSLRYVVPDIDVITLAGSVIAVVLIVTGLLLIWVAIFAMRPRGRHE